LVSPILVADIVMFNDDYMAAAIVQGVLAYQHAIKS
jgi:hypothetical protein